LGIEAYPQARDLFAFADAQRALHKLPALGVGLTRNGAIAGLGVAGERALGSGEWAALDDRFDVASVAKSVTATVAARLVEDGVIRWDVTIAGLFPEWRGVIQPAYQTVTLDMLLRHRSGLDRWMATNERWKDWHRAHAGQSATEMRRLFAAHVLSRPPRYAPGTDTHYCNDGYLVAGSLVERATGRPWEDLAQELVFGPLDLATMRYGVPEPTMPMRVVWGHERNWLGRSRAVAPDPREYGNPPFGAPSGFLYATVRDLLRYIDFHIQGTNGATPLLSRDAFHHLHTPLPGQRFALGWEVETTRDTSGVIVERSIYHGGYSGRSTANVWFSPESRTGTVIVYNDGGDETPDAYATIFFALLAEFGLR
jgi:CubicO group peptidase (beta-lactamase class C family)